MAEISIQPELIERRRRRLRVASLAVLALGVVIAAVVYWLGIRSANVMNDPAMADFDRAQRRQMGEFYGKMGTIDEQVMDAFKNPGSQAKMIVALSVLVAGGLLVASVSDHGEGQGGDPRD